MFFVYGPYGKQTSLLESLIYNHKNKKKLTLKNTKRSHDFIYVKDASKIIEKLTFQNIRSGIYNIGSGYCHSNLEFLNTFKQVLKKNKNNIKYKLKKNCLFSDNSKIKKNINFKINHNLFKGIKETLEVYNMI